MAGYIGSKAVLLSTTAAEVSGDALITGNLKVDTIQKTNGSAPTAKDLSLNISGNVLNHYYMDYETAIAQYTSATYADTGLTLDVTPTASNSKFIIQWQIFIYVTGSATNWSAVAARVQRDSTNIYTDSYTLGRGALYNPANDINHAMWNSGDVMQDSPNTTSEITYKVQYNSYGSTSVYLNYGDQKSYMSIFEIAG